MIRLATILDLDSIMLIIKEIQKEMKLENNPQWSEESDYPNRSRFMSDINNQELYVYEENNEIKGLMVIAEVDDYNGLVKTTNKPSYVLHRLAIKTNYRNQNLASRFFKYAEKLAKENQKEILKGDTEEHNVKMNALFKKLNFTKKGEFEYDDYPGHYIYYEKEII